MAILKPFGSSSIERSRDAPVENSSGIFSTTVLGYARTSARSERVGGKAGAV